MIDTALSVKRYAGFCWLVYGEGGMLMNPKAGDMGQPEWIGKVLDGAVVRVSPVLSGDKISWEMAKGKDGRPETLYSLRNGTGPLADGLFWRNSGEVCRMTGKPQVSVYGKVHQVSVVPIGPR